MEGQVVIDTMHLSIKYPKVDVFERWNHHVKGLAHRTLKARCSYGRVLD